jgi:quercetin dioxygenase-like cupin family protein
MQHDKENVSKAGLMAPTKLADLIAYQKGSVVSRAVVDRKSGTVTLFAFDKEQGLSEHRAPFDVLAYVVDGEAQVTVAGKSFALKEGEMVVMPANKLHALRATRRFKMLLVMIRA